MRRLMLLRHAKAERAELGGRDRDRKLAPRGRSDAELIGSYMIHRHFVPSIALISTAQRTRETWERVAANFPKPPPTEFDERIYNASANQLLDVLRGAPDAPSLTIVGHNPGLHELAVLLIASGDVEARQRVSEGLPTSGLVVIDLAFDDWSLAHPYAGRLERFVSPRLLTAATD